MSDVSVIGTGAMGSALVEALAASGADVMAWNRTEHKAEALSGPNVKVAASASEALDASSLAILTVSDHEQARALVASSDVDLDGTVVASASFVTPDQAGDFEQVVSAAGGEYLDLAIPAYPSQVRSEAGVFLVSGSRSAYEAHRDRFERIGQISYVDGTPGAAFACEMAVLLAYLPMAVGLLQGRRICEMHGLSVDWFNDTVMELYPDQIRSLLDRASHEPDASQNDVEASINVWGAGAAEYAEYLRELGIDTGMYDALTRLFAAASDAGDGESDWTCIAQHAATD